jgi:hypothetical protein
MQNDSFDLAAVTAAAGVAPWRDPFDRYVYSWRAAYVTPGPDGELRAPARSWRYTGQLILVPEAGTARCSAIIPDGTGNLAVVENLVLDTTAAAHLAAILRTHRMAFATQPPGKTEAGPLAEHYATLVRSMTPAMLIDDWPALASVLKVSDAPASLAQPVAPVDRLLHPTLPFMYYVAWPRRDYTALLFPDGLTNITFHGLEAEPVYAVALSYDNELLLDYPDARWEPLLTLRHALAVIGGGVNHSIIGLEHAGRAAIALHGIQEQILSGGLSMPEACQRVVAFLDPSCPDADRIPDMPLDQQRLTTTIAALAFLARAGETQPGAILDPASIKRAAGRNLTGDGNPYVIHFRNATIDLRIHQDLISGHATLAFGTALAAFPFVLNAQAFASVCAALARLETAATHERSDVAAGLVTRFREPWTPADGVGS